MLFVPIWDMNHLKAVRFQYVTVSIIVLNCLIYFLLQSNLILPSTDVLTEEWGLKPSDLVAGHSLAGPWHRAAVTLGSYMFLHANILHLLGNMIFLFVFGDNVEDAMGYSRFLVFYLLCGIVAGLTHVIFTQTPDAILIGASGAVSGVIGAYLLLHPNVRVWILFPLPSLPTIPLRFSAAFVIGVWIVYQGVSAYFFPAEATAWWAHLGGFAAGVLLILVMRRPGVRLFDMATGV